MHKIKGSLVLIIIFVSVLAGFINSYANDTLSDALRNGKINGELKVWYQTNDTDTGDNDIFDKGKQHI